MHVTGLGAELRQTLRGLVRRPARTALVIATLAVGIAATTGIYTVTDAVMVRSLPFPDADRLVAVGRVFPDRPWRKDAPKLQHLAGTSVATFVDWMARARSFDRLVAIERRSVLLPDRGLGPELSSSVAVTDGFFELMDVQPHLGRLLEPGDHAPGAPPVLILSHASWQTRYGADPDIVGQVESQSTIVGVLPAEFRGPETMVSERTEFWTALDVDNGRYDNRGGRSASVLGRLAPGITLDAARSEIATVQDVLADEYPNDNVFPDGSRFGAGVNMLEAQIIGGAGRPLSVFLGAAALLLLIAGMNSTNLLLLRGLERQSEMALRRALGAARGRLIVGMLLESLTLAAAGGLIGVLLASVGVTTFLELGGLDLPRLAGVSINPRVLAVSAVVSLGTGLLAGLIPALRLIRATGLSTSAREAGPSTVTTPGARLRTGLVTAQLAAALVLVIGAGLLFNSLLRVSNSDIGFEPNGLVSVSVPTKRPGPVVPDWELWQQLRREFQAVAGVTSVAVASDPPFHNPSWAPWVHRPGDPADLRLNDVSGFVITPEYFETIDARLIEGRFFDTGDGEQSESVAIVNRAFVRAHLADRAAVGATLDIGSEAPDSVRVVGVVNDVVLERVEDGARPAIYVPHTQEAWPYGAIVLVRSAREDTSFADELRQAAARFNPVAPVMGLDRMQDRIAATLAEPRFRALLLATFAIVSALLAIIGLYGTLTHLVRRRTRELGVRMALGADRRDIFGLVLRQGATVVAIGLVIGLAGSAALTRFLQSFLYGLDALDPVTFAAAGAAMALVALVAAFSPARRASRVDVATILRE